MAHIELPLHMIMKGVDKLPDSLWHKIPGFKPPKEEKGKANDDKAKEESTAREVEKEEAKRHHHRRRSEGHKTSSTKEKTRRAHSSSPHDSRSFEDDRQLDQSRPRGRRRRESEYEYKNGGEHRRESAQADWSRVPVIGGNESRPRRYSSAGYGYSAYNQSPTGAVPPQFPPPPHATTWYPHASASASRSSSVHHRDVNRRRSRTNSGSNYPSPNGYLPSQISANGQRPAPPPQAWHNHAGYVSTAAQRYTPALSAAGTPAMAGAAPPYASSPSLAPFPSFQPSPCLHPDCPSRSQSLSLPTSRLRSQGPPSSTAPPQRAQSLVTTPNIPPLSAPNLQYMQSQLSSPFFQAGSSPVVQPQPQPSSTPSFHSVNYGNSPYLPQQSTTSTAATSPPTLNLSNHLSRHTSVSSHYGPPLRGDSVTRSRTGSMKEAGAAGGPTRVAQRDRKTMQHLEELRDETTEPRIPTVKRAMTTGIIGASDNEKAERKIEKNGSDEEGEESAIQDDTDSDDSEYDKYESDAVIDVVRRNTS